MVVDTELGTGESLQNDAKPASGNVEATGLKPDAFGIGNPWALISEVCVDHKVLAASLIWCEPVGYTLGPGQLKARVRRQVVDATA